MTMAPAPQKAGRSPIKKAAKTPSKTAAPVTSTPAPNPIQPLGKSASKANKKKDKPEKVKVVRDSFTIPKTEYAQIAAIKNRATELGIPVKKSELIRAGLLLLATGSDTALRKAIGQVPTLKTGRPGKS